MARPGFRKTPTHKSILDNVLESYYHHFFDSGSKWFFNKSTNELVLYLKKYNIDEEDLHVDFEESL
ncbi:MAG: hypothetical protein PQ275_29130 [Elizabethkingia anophelis]|nr:MAG: hypothetical protein PQ275_29130 [Elizabethkingia anophelis]